MTVKRDIMINVKPNLAGPPGWDSVMIVMAFDNKDAIQFEGPLTPVAWKVAAVLLNQPQLRQSITITYLSNTGVSEAQIINGDIVSPGPNIPLVPGQQTTLQLVDGAVNFSAPVAFTPRRLSVKNELAILPTIVAGLYFDTTFFPITAWQSIPNQMTLDFGFTPVLSIYAAVVGQQSQLMPGDLEGLLWKGNLNLMPDPVQFTLVWNDEESLFQLVPSF